MSVAMQRAVIRYKRPQGSRVVPISETMREALMLLTESVELEPLYEDAERRGRAVAIELFQSNAGLPLLIHFTMEAIEP